MVGLFTVLAWYYNMVNWLYRMIGHQPGLITYIPPAPESYEHQANALQRFFSVANVDDPSPPVVTKKKIYVLVPFYSCNKHILTPNRPDDEYVAVAVDNPAPNTFDFLESRAPGTLAATNANRYIRLRRRGTGPTAGPRASGSDGNGVVPAANNAMRATGRHSNLPAGLHSGGGPAPKLNPSTLINGNRVPAPSAGGPSNRPSVPAPRASASQGCAAPTGRSLAAPKAFAPLANNRVGYVLPATHYPFAPTYLSKEYMQALADGSEDTDSLVAFEGLPTETVQKLLLTLLRTGGVITSEVMDQDFAGHGPGNVTYLTKASRLHQTAPALLDPDRVSEAAYYAAPTTAGAAPEAGRDVGVSDSGASDSDETEIITGDDGGAPVKKRKRDSSANPFSGGDGDAGVEKS